MDAWDDEFSEPSKSEQSARRALALAIGLINARRPLTTGEILQEYYPTDASQNSLLKTFARDRTRLQAAGLVIKNGKKVDDQQTWEVDAAASFVRASALTTTDALVLDTLLLPLASDPSFPYARDLRLALTKIDRSFDGTSEVAIPPEARLRNNSMSRLEDCMTAGHLAQITYHRVDGSSVERVVAPYGFFYLSGHTYMVAAQKGEENSPHTYRLDRVSHVREQARSSFVRPADFDVRDFVLPPFALGPIAYEATFVAADGTHRTEQVADENLAAAWAITKGLLPTDPPSLVGAWRAKLETVCGDDHDER